MINIENALVEQSTIKFFDLDWDMFNYGEEDFVKECMLSREKRDDMVFKYACIVKLHPNMTLDLH